MTAPADVDREFLVDFLVGLLNTPSPTGYTRQAIAYTQEALARLGLNPHPTTKGALLVSWEGKANDTPRALTAHVDTLGAVVKEIKANGRLKLSKVGGFAWNTVEGEGCNVHTASGAVIRGSLMPTKASVHIHSQGVGELERNDDNLEVRLDERSASAEETRALGIEVGDFVAFDPRVEVAASGFIRARHLDDKSGVACLLAAAKAVQESGRPPAQRTTLHISNYEEVGHGAAGGLPDDLVELVTIDMAPVGEGQNSDEFHPSLCAKDAGGPYHSGLTHRLRQLAQEAGIPYKMDVYPHYGSDGEAYWRAGGDVQVALLGPGVDASHHYERTHLEALVSTSQWIAAYLWS